jgi:hypothetical protein
MSVYKCEKYYVDYRVTSTAMRVIYIRGGGADLYEYIYDKNYSL